MTSRLGRLWFLSLAVVLLLTSGCSGDAGSRQAEVDHAVKATLTADAETAPTSPPAATATPLPSPTVAPSSTPAPTATPAPTSTSTLVQLEDLDLSEALLHPEDITLAGEYPAERWVTCSGYGPFPLWIADAMKASVKSEANVSHAVGSCNSYTMQIGEQLVLAANDRQAERVSADMANNAASNVQLIWPSTVSTALTESGSLSLIQFEPAEGHGAIVVAQKGSLTIGLSVLSAQRLVASDYRELVDTAVARIGLAQQGR